MSVTSEGTQGLDIDRNHGRMSTSSQKSKAEQLARTRRNQQRCRERKRTHVAELESQVEALQAKIRHCEPCSSPSPPEHESALDTALRENAARKDLLLALGFDDETQQRFIESAVKRQAVHTILQGEHDRANPIPSPDKRLAEIQVAPYARVDAPSVSRGAESADLRFGSDQAMDSLNRNTELMDVAVNQQANVLDPAVEDWLFSPDTLEKLPPQLMNPSSDISWLTEPYNGGADFAQGIVNDVEPTSMNDISNGLQWASMTSKNNQAIASASIERCFLDTVVQFQPGETSTVCSIALALIFRYNRKGLSMAELQTQLKPEMRSPSGASGECCIENSVLFRVLADISM